MHTLPSSAEWETLCIVDVEPQQQTQAILESQIKMYFPNGFFVCVFACLVWFDFSFLLVGLFGWLIV